MNESTLRAALADLNLSMIQYYDQIGSTNDQVQIQLEQGAPDGILVVADAQTQGRGRLGRRWLTNPGAALAFSLGLRPNPVEREHLPFFSPLAGLAVCQVLRETYQLPAEVKWPNDVLIARRKVCGVLVEASWEGDRLRGVVVGIGVNVTPAALPPESDALFPATCVEQALGRPVDREELLGAILRSFWALRPGLGSPAFCRDWQAHLAFRGQEVRVDLPAPEPALVGVLTGIDGQGNLCLRVQDQEFRVAAGDVRLRPLE